MLVFRIVAKKYSKELSASGRPGRWNHSDQAIIYCSESRSLATLELLVGRGGINTGIGYQLLVIEVPDVSTESVGVEQLPQAWRSLNSYSYLQQIGSDWYQRSDTLLLKVPSAVVPQEFNFLINYSHPDFRKTVKIRDNESYFWDERLV